MQPSFIEQKVKEFEQSFDDMLSYIETHTGQSERERLREELRLLIIDISIETMRNIQNDTRNLK